MMGPKRVGNYFYKYFFAKKIDMNSIKNFLNSIYFQKHCWWRLVPLLFMC